MQPGFFDLLTSAALNMIVVPALYLRFGIIEGRGWETAAASATVGVVSAETAG